jgi:hypothetical protein
MSADQLPTIIPPGSLTGLIDTLPVPALVAGAGDAAGWRYVEFFTANIRNLNTRAGTNNFICHRCAGPSEMTKVVPQTSHRHKRAKMILGN